MNDRPSAHDRFSDVHATPTCSLVAAKIVSESHFLNGELSLNCLNSSVRAELRLAFARRCPIPSPLSSNQG